MSCSLVYAMGTLINRINIKVFIKVNIRTGYEERDWEFRCCHDL